MKNIASVLAPALVSFLLFSCKKDPAAEPAASPNDITNTLIWGSATSAQRVIGSKDMEVFSDLSTVPAGGYVFCGFIQDGSTNRKGWIVRTDTQGNTTWMANSALNEIHGIKSTSDNGYMIHGISTTSSWIARLDSTGAQQWQLPINFHARGMKIAADGSFYLCGLSDLHPRLEKRSPNGMIDFSKTYHMGIEFSTLELLANGDVILIGKTGQPTSGNLTAVRTNSAGDTLWTKTYMGGYLAGCSDVLAMPNGNILFSGSISATGGFLKMLDSSGNELWHRNYKDYDIATVNGLVLTTNGDIIATGRHSWNNFGKGMMIRFDHSGTIIWKRKYEVGQSSILTNIHLTDDGGYITGGSIRYNNNGEGFILKTDENGN